MSTIVPFDGDIRWTKEPSREKDTTRRSPNVLGVRRTFTRNSTANVWPIREAILKQRRNRRSTCKVG